MHVLVADGADWEPVKCFCEILVQKMKQLVQAVKINNVLHSLCFTEIWYCYGGFIIKSSILFYYIDFNSEENI